MPGTEAGRKDADGQEASAGEQNFLWKTELLRMASGATRRSQGALGPPISEVSTTLYRKWTFSTNTQILFGHGRYEVERELPGGRLAAESSGHRHGRRHGHWKGHRDRASALRYVKQPPGPRMPDVGITPISESYSIPYSKQVYQATHTNKKEVCPNHLA